MDKNDVIDGLKTLLIITGMLTVIIVIVCLICNSAEAKDEKELSNKIHSYKTITVNGEVFDTDNILDVDIHKRSYENDTVTFAMKDGTEVEVQIGNWTLKN
jgi:hypothetical protein